MSNAPALGPAVSIGEPGAPEPVPPRRFATLAIVLRAFVLVIAWTCVVIAALFGPPALAFTVVRGVTGDLTVGLGPVYLVWLASAAVVGGWGAAVLLLDQAGRNGARRAKWVEALVLALPLVGVAVAVIGSKPITRDGLETLAVTAAITGVLVGLLWLGHPPPDVTETDPVAADRRRRHIRNIAVGLAAYTLVCGAFYIVIFHGSFRHDLVVADFDTTAAPFPTGPQDGFTATTVDGSYAMTQTSVETQLFVSPADIDGRPSTVVASVDVGPAAGATADPTSIGIGCLANASTGSGVFLLASPDGHDVRLVDWSHGQGVEALKFDRYGSIDGPVHQLSVTCETIVDIGSSVHTHVTGSVNGVEVVSGTTTGAQDSRVALAFEGAAPGTAVRFDNLLARVP